MSSQQTINNFRRNKIRQDLHSINTGNFRTEKTSKNKKKYFENSTELSLERLEELGHQFIEDYYKEDRNWPDKEKWPKSTYGVSKVLVNGITRIYAREAVKDKNGVLGQGSAIFRCQNTDQIFRLKIFIKLTSRRTLLQ